MKHAHSLEEERQALLEQIHASRDVYRRMLTQSDAPQKNSTESHVSVIRRDAAFPRSMTVRWIIEHPYLCAAAATAIVVAAPLAGRVLATRRTGASANPAANRSRAVAADPIKNRRTVRTRSTDMAGNAAAPAGLVVAGRAAVTGLATAMMMLLRDPVKMRMAGRVFSTVTGFVQARRSRR